jgi:invasion protein IalB
MSVAKPLVMPDIRVMSTRLRTFFIAASLAAVALAMSATSASAGLLVKDAPDCTAKPTTQPFKPWGDSSAYNLAPGGSFEAGTQAWSLSGKASMVSGNEPWKVAGSTHSRSLKLPPGASATSPTICVGLEHPAIRFFAKNDSLLLSTMSVEVITETSLGLTVALPIGVLLPSGKWKPGPKLLVLANLLPLLPGEYTPVRFRVTSIGIGNWWVDDFYVDPRCR